MLEMNEPGKIQNVESKIQSNLPLANHALTVSRLPFCAFAMSYEL